MTSKSEHQHHSVKQLRKLFFKIPRVVPDQRQQFFQEEIFRKHLKLLEVRYTLHQDQSTEERQRQFYASCRNGRVEVTYPSTGLSLILDWTSELHQARSDPYNNKDIAPNNFCDFTKDHGKVHIRSSMILNGVCVYWHGWVDLHRLEGMGCLEFDGVMAYQEDALLKKQLQFYNRHNGSDSGYKM